MINTISVCLFIEKYKCLFATKNNYLKSERRMKRLFKFSDEVKVGFKMLVSQKGKL